MTDAATQVPEPTKTDPRPASKPPESESKIARVDLGKLGPRLPLGVIGSDGSVNKDLVCKPWRGKEEREVGKLKKQGKESGDFITRLISYMFTKVGPHDFASMEEPEKRAVLSSMYMGDVFYMYVWLRTQTNGKSLKMTLSCPRCSFDFPFAADLDSVEVRTAEKYDHVKWSYALEIPFEVRGQMAQGFDLAPMRWQAMESSIKTAVDTGDTDGSKMEIIQGCVQRVTGREEMVLIEQDFDEIEKVDIEQLSAKIDENEIGPDMSVKEKCPRCERRFTTSLDWGYESFFSASSLS